MKYEAIYQKLKEKYTDEEIVDAMLIPADVTEEEKQTLAAEMKAIRMQKWNEMTGEDRILSTVMQLRVQMESYIQQNEFSFEKTFGKYLENYITILNKSVKEIATDLSIPDTKLNKIINEKEEPSIEVAYRLEKHSGDLISAALWWKLVVKKQEFIITKDEVTKRLEQKSKKCFEGVM